MSNNKQSSIDFLIEEVKKHHPLWKDIFIKAKAMHKEEIIKANRDGVDMVIDKKPYTTGEDYYNKTFKK